MILIFVFGIFSFIPANLRYFPTVTGGRRRDSTTTTKSYPLPIPSVTKIEMKDSKLSCLHLLLFPEEKQIISAAIKSLSHYMCSLGYFDHILLPSDNTFGFFELAQFGHFRRQNLM